MLSYSVARRSGTDMLSTEPAIATNGTLTFTAAENANGTASFDVTVRDNGPTSGANDNASGMAGAIEAARVLSKYKFEKV